LAFFVVFPFLVEARPSFPAASHSFRRPKGFAMASLFRPLSVAALAVQTGRFGAR
jgi:hypothetical protein